MKLGIFKLNTLKLLLVAILDCLASFGVLPGERLLHHPIQLHPEIAYLILEAGIFTAFFYKISFACVKLGLEESQLCLSSLTSLLQEDPGLASLFNLSPQLGELQFKRANGATLLFKLTLAPDELLELLLVGVEKLEPRVGFLQLLRGLLKGGLEDLVVSESLGHLADLLVFEL